MTAGNRTVPGNSGGLRVLVVDDLSEMRVIIHRALSDRGYQVDVAATIEQAREMSPGGYDAVLVDAHLGPERGTDLVEAMLAEDPAAASRCLVMTGGPTGALPDGIAYLAKPFHLGELIDAVSALHQPRAGPAAHRQPGSTPAAQGQAASTPTMQRQAASTPTMQRQAASTPAAHREAGITPAAHREAGITPAAHREAGITPTMHREAAIAPDAGAHSPTPVPSGEYRPGTGLQAWRLLGLTRRLRARERHELVDFLHDGPIQELTAVTLELQMTRRSMPDPSALDGVLQRLDAAAGSLRWLVDGQWPFQSPETQLAATLRQRTAWLLAAPVAVDLDEPTAGLATTEMQVVVDVVELMLLAMVAGPPVRAHVAVRTEAHLIGIDLTLMAAAGENQEIGDPALARTALDGLASALGTSAETALRECPWRVQIALAREPAAAPHGSGPPRG
jgi:CheY-like chemotaxis protein